MLALFNILLFALLIQNHTPLWLPCKNFDFLLLRELLCKDITRSIDSFDIWSVISAKMTLGILLLEPAVLLLRSDSLLLEPALLLFSYGNLLLDPALLLLRYVTVYIVF